MSEAAAFENLRYAKKEQIARVTVARPKVLNALDATTMRELGDAFQMVRDDDDVRVAILTGEGDKAFVAGADITELTSLEPAAATALASRGQAVFSLIEGCGKPVIAAVNGFALGAGCELAMACSFRIASEMARFGQPETRLGLIPGYGGTQRLPRLVGKGMALQLILTGEMISAAEALRIGLVNEVVPAAELLPRAAALAAKILANGPLAVGYALQAVQQGMNMPLAEAMAHEAALFGLACASDDKAEGTRAFLEKRAPQFKGK
jgi:enoyl-CoA hydratase/carnithine racemase